MSKSGFTFHWEDVYWASLTVIHSTEKERDDIYFGPVRVRIHQRSWLKWSESQLVELGSRLKDETAAHRPPHTLTTGLSTGTMAQFTAEYDPETRTVTTTVSDVFSGTEYVSNPAVSNSTGSRRELPTVHVDVPDDTRRIEGEIAYCTPFAGGDPGGLSTQAAFLPISKDGSVGISIQITKRST